MDLLQRDGYRLRAPEPEDLGVMILFENTTSLWEALHYCAVLDILLECTLYTHLPRVDCL